MPRPLPKQENLPRDSTGPLSPSFPRCCPTPLQLVFQRGNRQPCYYIFFFYFSFLSRCERRGPAGGQRWRRAPGGGGAAREVPAARGGTKPAAALEAALCERGGDG